MIGSLFAGTDESPGELILCQGRSFKSYRGMGSIGAMKEGSKDRYFQERGRAATSSCRRASRAWCPTRGRSPRWSSSSWAACAPAWATAAAATIPDLQARARFVKISPAGLKESHVHDVIITKEAPNYRLE